MDIFHLLNKHFFVHKSILKGLHFHSGIFYLLPLQNSSFPLLHICAILGILQYPLEQIIQLSKQTNNGDFYSKFCRLFQSIFQHISFSQFCLFIIEINFSSLDKCEFNNTVIHIENIAFAYNNVGIFSCFYASGNIINA